MPIRTAGWTLLAISVLTLPGVTHAVERSEVPEKYRWDLLDEIERIYAKGALK